MHDIIIVGGGPVGLYLAHLLEKRLDVLVLDKNPSFGKKADSGLYSAHLADFIPLQEEWIEHAVTGAVLHSPSGGEIALKKHSTAAYVVNREKFTSWLSTRVSSPIQLKTRVNDISIADTVTVSTTTGSYESRMLIGCDGASSIVRKHFGVRPSHILNGLIATTRERNTSATVDIYVDKERISDGFFWKIPRGATTEYGALGTGVNFACLDDFFRIHDYTKAAAFMNLGLFQTAFPHTILVGEAAGQVKPWSLGGIIFGFTCAAIARDTIFNAFAQDNFSEQVLSAYDDAWKKKIGGTIRWGMAARGFFEKMDNTSLERWFRILRKLPFLNALDMDFPILKHFGALVS